MEKKHLEEEEGMSGMSEYTQLASKIIAYSIYYMLLYYAILLFHYSATSFLCFVIVSNTYYIFVRFSMFIL